MALQAAPADPSDELDGTPPPLPSQRQQSRGLFFPNSDQEDPTGEESLPSPDGDGWPSGTSTDSPDLGWSDDAPTSSAASSPDPASKAPLNKRALKPMFRQGVLIGSGMAHRFGARTEGQQLAGMYLADDEDAAAIADPLAAIAARREGIAGKISPDTADFISSMMGVAGWMSKQMVRAQQATAYDAQRAGAATIDPAGNE